MKTDSFPNSVVQYSPLLSASHFDRKASVQIIYVDCRECYNGRNIVYDLSNLVYNNNNNNIQNRCIQMLLLYTSVLFNILGFVLSQNF